MISGYGIRTALLAVSLVACAVAQEAGRSALASADSLPASRAEHAPLPAVSEPVAARSLAVWPANQRESIHQFLNQRMGDWCRRLKLEDWQVALVMSRRDSLRPKTLGKIQWDKKRKSAVIEVMDPADYTMDFQPMLNDMELTLVHELVHLSLASLPRSEASRRNEEDVVSRLADALFSLEPHSGTAALTPATTAGRPAGTR